MQTHGVGGEQLARTFSAIACVHIWQDIEIGNSICTHFPSFDLAVLHNDVFVQEVTLVADDQVLSDPVVALGPLDLALPEVGPVAQLLNIADDGQVLPVLRLILY